MGSVLIWHMYQPLSFSWTRWSCKIHSLDEGRLRDMRGLRVITLLCIVKIVCVSTRTQATYKEESKMSLLVEAGLAENDGNEGWVRFPLRLSVENLLCNYSDFPLYNEARHFDLFERWRCQRILEKTASGNLKNSKNFMYAKSILNVSSLVIFLERLFLCRLTFVCSLNWCHLDSLLYQLYINCIFLE